MSIMNAVKLKEMEGYSSGDSVNDETEPESSNESQDEDEFAGSSDNDELESDSNEKSNNVNAGWADSIAKILKTNKPKTKKSLVLSKAKLTVGKTLKKEEQLGFEIIDDVKQETSDIKTEPDEDGEPVVKKPKRELHADLRVKPNILERERERLLSKIATRGVVQLFNTVRNQQKDIDRQMEEAGPLERKKAKVMKNLDKTKFLDKLMGESKSENVNKSLASKFKTEKKPKEDDSSTWNVFREDFMMGAKMKDWDKKEQGSEEEAVLSDSDSE